MKPRHVALAVLAALIWGSNFVVIKLGLGRYPPLLFSALRFACAALVLPAFPRPRIGWGRLAVLGLVLFACQFGCFIGIVAVVFNGLLATVVGFGIWGHLLRRYPAATVAPFALLVPTVGMASAALVFGERLGPARLAGALLIVAGLAVLVLGRPRALFSVPLADA